MAKKRALVVDDSKLARYVMKKMLSEYGMDVDTVESAEEALGYLSHQKCNIVFMDQMMPGMDGLEAVKAIKEDPETANIPVMMYTSKGGEVFVGQARKLGAYGVMPKQVKPVELYKVLRKLQLITQQAQKATPGEAKPATVKESPARESDIGDSVLESALANEETIEEIAQVAAESVEQHSFPSQVKRLLNEQTQLLRREFSRQTRRVIENQIEQISRAETAEPTKLDPKEFALGALKMVAAAVIVLLPTIVFVSTFDSDQVKASNQSVNTLRAENAVLVDKNEQLTQRLNSLVKHQQVMLDSIEWAVNKTGRYGFEELVVDQKKTQVIYELVSRLSSIEFKGQVTIDGYLGNYCVKNDPEAGITVADAKSSMQECKTLKQLVDSGRSIVEKQTFAFNEFMSRPFVNVSEDIQISGTFHGLEKTVIKYPSQSIVDRAGEWNSIAEKNNRLVITLTPENEWLELVSDSGG